MMQFETTAGEKLEGELLQNYFRSLVNHFFKVLPMKENGEESLPTYLNSLMAELLGCKSLVITLNNNADYITILSILQYLIDNIENPDFHVVEVRREVFHAISLCNKLSSRFAESEVH